MAYDILKTHLRKMTTAREVGEFFHDWRSQKGWVLKNKYEKDAYHEITFFRLEVRVRIRLTLISNQTSVNITYKNKILTN